MFDGFYTQPPCYANIRRAACELRETYPFVKVFPIGKSVLGRSIYAFGIGELYHGALYVGGVHGMEWLTTLLLFRFTEDLLRAIATGEPLAEIDVNRTLENRSVVLIPCLNPDGVEISLNGPCSAKHLAEFVRRVSGGDTSRWQANARGIDLNHNFDAGYPLAKQMEQQAGICSPAPTRLPRTASRRAGHWWIFAPPFKSGRRMRSIPRGRRSTIVMERTHRRVHSSWRRCSPPHRAIGWYRPTRWLPTRGSKTGLLTACTAQRSRSRSGAAGTRSPSRNWSRSMRGCWRCC